MAGDGTGEKRLTPAQGEYFTPVWSPDGKRIAFASRRIDNTDVYVVNADGSDEKRLTSDAGNDFDPAWSPDGKRIAFTRQVGRTTDRPTCYVVDAGGGGERPLAVHRRRRVRAGVVARRHPDRLHPGEPPGAAPSG